jgi:hypothetical protein
MKKMAMVLICVMVLSTLALSSNPVEAVSPYPDWFNCTVTNCGLVFGNVYFVHVTTVDGQWQGTNTFFIDAADASSKAAYASMLTAYANNGQVSLYIPSQSVTPNTFISGCTVGFQ